MTCEKCGHEMRIGEWPYCPHQDARTFGEEPIQPYWDEHVCPEGAQITTRAERRRIMAKGNLEYLDVSKAKRGKVFVFMGK